MFAKLKKKVLFFSSLRKKFVVKEIRRGLESRTGSAVFFGVGLFEMLDDTKSLQKSRGRRIKQHLALIKLNREMLG